MTSAEIRISTPPLLVAALATLLAACSTSGDSSDPAGNAGSPQPARVTVTVEVSGAGAVTSSPSGVNCDGSCTNDFTQGTSITLSATANSGWRFVGWGDACFGAGLCQLTLEQAANVRASFEMDATSGGGAPPSPLPPVATGALYAAKPSSNAAVVTLHPGPDVARNQAETVVFGLPFAPGWVSSTDTLSVETSDGRALAANISELARWRPIAGTNAITDSVRAARIVVDYSFSGSAPENIIVRLNGNSGSSLGRSVATRDTWTSSSRGPQPDEYAGGVPEPRVYATLTADWLSASLLRTRTLPIANNNSEWAQFDTALENFGRTAVNDVEPEVNPSQLISFESTAAPWLYDRANSLFGLYVRTGDVKWLRHAHRASEFYATQLAADGSFNLKSFPDLKYSYGYSLLTDMLLLGDTTQLPKIESVASFAMTFRDNYNPSGNFWTERHATYALLGRLAAWEATGDVQYADAAKSLVSALVAEARSPQLGVAGIGCVQHTIRQHEGDNDDRPACSPWMSALLSDAVWRYFLLTGDRDALDFIAGLGDFVVDHGTYVVEGVNGQVNGLTVPWYLAADGVEYTDSGAYGDLEHGCDVASLTARAAWAQRRLGRDSRATSDTTMALLSTCYFALDYWHREGSHLSSNRPQWRLAPPRKFSWWFGTASDLAWFEAN